jgi:hypothetical protein
MVMTYALKLNIKETGVQIAMVPVPVWEGE